MDEIALISDVHGNQEAFEAVLNIINGMPTYHLGDLVGYGPNPKECIALAREAGIVSLMGNHDFDVAHNTLHRLVNPVARESLIWTMAQLDAEDKAYLGGLPYSISLADGRLTLVHGDLTLPEDFTYLFDEAALLNFDRKLNDGQGAAVGHTHTPQVWYPGSLFPEKKTFEEGREFSLGKKAIFNVGSVGQPRDGDYRACLVILNLSEDITATMQRISYDLAKTQSKLKELPLDQVERLGTLKPAGEHLAGRLGSGR